MDVLDTATQQRLTCGGGGGVMLMCIFTDPLGLRTIIFRGSRILERLKDK